MNATHSHPYTIDSEIAPMRDIDVENAERDAGADAVQALWPLKGGGIAIDREEAVAMWSRMTETQQHTTLEEFALYNAGGAFGLGYV